MSEAHRKSEKLNWLNVVVLTLLLVSGGFTLTACQQLQLKPESPEQGDSTEQLPKNQPTDAKPNQDQNYEKQGQDSQEDDDPE